MSENYFVINTQLPSLNDYQNVCRYNRFAAAKFKKEYEEAIEWAILKGKNSGTLQHITAYPVQLDIEWHEKDRRRDVDNIKSAAKFILDGMTKVRLIKDDSRKYISQIHDTIVDDKKTFVIVRIKDGNNQQLTLEEEQ